MIVIDFDYFDSKYRKIGTFIANVLKSIVNKILSLVKMTA